MTVRNFVGLLNGKLQFFTVHQTWLQYEGHAVVHCSDCVGVYASQLGLKQTATYTVRAPAATSSTLVLLEVPTANLNLLSQAQGLIPVSRIVGSTPRSRCYRGQLPGATATVLAYCYTPSSGLANLVETTTGGQLTQILELSA